MEDWETAWLGCQPMPPYSFLQDLKEPMQTIAEAWLLSNQGRRVGVEEWVSRERSYEIAAGLLWTGFRRKGELAKRVRPIPVCVQMLYAQPPPADVEELWQRMNERFSLAFRQWRQSYLQAGDDLEPAP